MMPLVSLIVPIFNGERYIDSFMEQFEAQDYKNLELVIVNDGSNDNTYVKCKGYAEKDSRIKLYNQMNKGPSAARNFGISVANGKYIAFLDIDDYFYPTYVSYLYDILQECGADISFCNYRKVTKIDSDIIAKYMIGNEDKKIYDREQAIEDFSYRRNLTGYSYLKLIKSSILEGVLFPENIVYGEDFIFTYKLLKKCTRVVYGEKIQYLYLQVQDSSTHQKRDNTKKYQDAWEMHLEYVKDVKVNFGRIESAAISKCYLLAINNTTRVYDRRRDSGFLEELFKFIKQNAKVVWKDKRAKITSRALGLMGMVSAKMTCRVCHLLFAGMDRLKITFKRTV